MAVRKVAWMGLVLVGCGSPAFVGGSFNEEEDAGVYVVDEKIPDTRPPDVREDEKIPDAGVLDVREEESESPDPCESCEAPANGTAVCVDGACGFTCPAACTKTSDGCDCPLAQCCDDVQCGGVSCNRGQCSGTYTTCDEPRCWAWCVSCQGKKGGSCPPLNPTAEVYCECD